MTAFIDENTQFVDGATNTLLAGGLVYIGVVGLNPKTNPIDIFADRALTMSLLNPQTLNDEGRSTNKIWIPGEYSLLVEDVLGGQHLQELDQGDEPPGGDFINLGAVSGTNDITAEGTPTITTLVDQTIYSFQTVGNNTQKVTLKIDGTLKKDIKQNVDQEIQANKFRNNQTVLVAFNSFLDIYEWVNHTDKIIYLTKTPLLPSNTQTPIWDQLGNDIDISLGVSPVDSFGTAPAAGAFREIKTTGIITFTNSANLVCPGGVDLITSVGDSFRVKAISTSIAEIYNYNDITINPKFTEYVFSGPLDLQGSVPRILIQNLINAQYIVVSIRSWEYVSAGNTSPEFQFLVGGIPVTSGYNSAGSVVPYSATNPGRESSSSGFNIGRSASNDNSDQFSFETWFSHLGNNFWNYMTVGQENTFYLGGSGKIQLAGPITGLQLNTKGDSTDIDSQGSIANVVVRQSNKLFT